MSDLFKVTDDPKRIRQKILTEAILCFVLNKRLSNRQIGALCDKYYILQMQIRNEKRFVHLAGLYRQKQSELPPEVELYNEPILEKYFWSLIRVSCYIVV